MGAHVYGQVAGRRAGLAAGGAGAGAVASMGAHVCRQAAGLREGLAAGGAIEVGRISRPSRSPSPSFGRRFFPSPLASDHRGGKGGGGNGRGGQQGREDSEGESCAARAGESTASRSETKCALNGAPPRSATKTRVTRHRRHRGPLPGFQGLRRAVEPAPRVSLQEDSPRPDVADNLQRGCKPDALISSLSSRVETLRDGRRCTDNRPQHRDFALTQGS